MTQHSRSSSFLLLTENEAPQDARYSRYYDAFMDADGCTNLRTTAKELNVPERWFARFLQQTGFLYRSPAGNLMPYALPRNRGLFRVRDYVRNGHSGAYTLITPMGKSLFRELLRCGEAVSN